MELYELRIAAEDLLGVGERITNRESQGLCPGGQHGDDAARARGPGESRHSAQERAEASDLLHLQVAVR